MLCSHCVKAYLRREAVTYFSQEFEALLLCFELEDVDALLDKGGHSNDLAHVEDYLLLFMLGEVQDVIHQEQHQLAAVHGNCQVLQSRLLRDEWHKELQGKDE